MKSSFFYSLKNGIIIKKQEYTYNKISTDTRTIGKDDFYIPLKGENFDGENFIEHAVKQGAAGFLTSNKKTAEKYIDDDRVKTVIYVPDTKTAYMELAQARITEAGYKVVGITGSSGKTTTKEMVYTVISESFNTWKTKLNHNNEIGFCQTVFDAPEGTHFLILEMGMRGPGEIELISKYARPDIGIITNIGTAHIGRLGSQDNIARAKCEITKYIKPDGIFIARNCDLVKKHSEFKGITKYYSIDDVVIKEQHVGYSRFDYEGFEYELPIEGAHNIENALAAINAGLFIGIPPKTILKGLRNFETLENRWNVEKIGGYKIINDCYNANPDSMKATVGTILDMYDEPVLVLGDMGELGEDAAKYHAKIGEFINSHPKTTQNTVVLTVGKLSKEISKQITNCVTKNFDNITQAADYILKNKNIGNILFFKASRSMKFEEIINKLRKKGET